LFKSRRGLYQSGFSGSSPIPTLPLPLNRVKSKAPSLHQHYPASSVLRASPPPHTARPISHEVPVDAEHPHHRWGFPFCVCFPVCACCRHYPGRTAASCSLVLSQQLRPSPRGRRVGSCIACFEACSTFILVTACTLTESLKRLFLPKASATSLPLPLLRLLPGGTNQFPGGSTSR
jgi:hypothetical protein